MPDDQQKNVPAEQPVAAKIVHTDIADGEIVPAVLANDQQLHSLAMPTTAGGEGLLLEESQFETRVNHLSAKGGAVGGLLLGLLGLAGMALSAYSFFNVTLALAFSIWGLKSPLRKTALMGLLAGLAGLVAFLIKVGS